MSYLKLLWYTPTPKNDQKGIKKVDEHKKIGIVTKKIKKMQTAIGKKITTPTKSGLDRIAKRNINQWNLLYKKVFHSQSRKTTFRG